MGASTSAQAIERQKIIDAASTPAQENKQQTNTTKNEPKRRGM